MTEKRILIIDDAADNIRQFEGVFAEMGFSEVNSACGGGDGWVAMKSKSVDCVVAAYEMQDMSGLALLKIIRKEDDFCDLPFLLTDNAFTKVKVIRAGQSGVSGLIVMPFDKDRVQDKITAIMEKGVSPIVQDAQNAFDEGVALMEKKDYPKALAIFTSLVKQQDNPEYYFNIGYIKTSQGKHGEAIEAFSMATRLDRLFGKAYEEMGRVYRLMGDNEKAEEYMRMAAEVYMDTNKIGAAEEVLNDILEAGTDSLNVFNTLGVFYRKKGDPEEALKQYQKALKVHPDEPYIYYNMGRLYLDMKKKDEAKVQFELALAKDPSFDEAKQVIKAIDLGIV